MARTDTQPVIVGRVSGLYGVRGWMKIHSYTDPREGILAYPDWLVESGNAWQSMAVAEGKPHGKTIIARLEGIDDRDTAAVYVQAAIGVERAQLPETAEGEYYWADLEGLAVRNKDGTVLGTVAHLLETGANDVLVVREADREVLVPFVLDEVVRAVDLARGVIDVDWDWD